MAATTTLRLLVLLALALLQGCASTSVFNPYPAQAVAFRQATAGHDTQKVLAALEKKAGSGDRILYLAERGRINQLAGDYAASKADFERVLAAWRENDDKAKLSATGTAAQGAALMTNDNAIPYKGYGYERVLVHLFQAYNYLGLGDAEGAQVELRNAQQLQRQLELEYAGELAAAEGEATGKDVDLGSFDSHFAGMDTITGPLRNSFQNGYSFYFAASVWEALGEFNDALVDYKKTLELSPRNEQLQADVLRADRRADGLSRVTPGTGTVVVLYEQGFVPAKLPVSLPIPTFDGGIFAISFPVYDASTYVPPTPLTVTAADGSRARTALLSDTSALAVKALREQVPAMLVRQVLRARAKYEFQKKMGEQAGIGGQFFANIYNLVSEQADLRSWLTLPANAQGTRLELPAGPQRLEAAADGGSLGIEVDVRPGRTTLVRVVETNGRLVAQVFPL